jgi:prevent-host-death family protein
MASISAREFNQDVSAAKRTALTEPVVITDRGTPSHVLLSIEAYRRLATDQRSIVDWLSSEDEIEIEIEHLAPSLRIADL